MGAQVSRKPNILLPPNCISRCTYFDMAIYRSLLVCVFAAATAAAANSHSCDALGVNTCEEDELSVLQKRYVSEEHGGSERIHIGQADDQKVQHFGFDVEYFNTSEVNEKLPLPPDSLNYPPQLDGMIWLDQSGYYGYSDIPAAVAAPDAGASFGDVEFSTLERSGDGGTIKISTHGPAWQWFNNFQGHMSYYLLSHAAFYYNFEFTNNFNHVEISPTLNLGTLDAFIPPEFLVNFTMEYQSLYLDETACPRTSSPEIEACLGVDKGREPDDSCYQVKRNIARCAKWDRVSNVLGGEARHYYAFEIVDKHGQKREPYFTMYLNWINSQTNDNLGFRGVRGHEGLIDLGDDCDHDYQCRSKCCNWHPALTNPLRYACEPCNSD